MITKTGEKAMRRVHGGAGPRRPWTWFVCLLAIGAATVGGQSNGAPLSFTTYTTADGMSSDIVRSVYARGSYIYASHSFYGTGLSVSADNGATWSTVTTTEGLGSDVVEEVTGVGSAVYTATMSGVSISNDLGSTWSDRNQANGFPGEGSYAIFATAGTIYASYAINDPSTRGVARSTDNGSTWSSSVLAGSVYTIFADGSNVYAGTNQGLEISADGGATWNNHSFGANKIVWGAWGNGSTVYAATEDDGLWASTDGGATWAKNGLADNMLRGLFVSAGTLYVSGGGGLSISSDGGATWQNYTSADGLGSDFCLDAYVDGNKLYVATAGGVSVATLTSAVPEIDPSGLGSVVALLSGGLGLLERRRRAFAVS